MNFVVLSAPTKALPLRGFFAFWGAAETYRTRLKFLSRASLLAGRSLNQFRIGEMRLNGEAPSGLNHVRCGRCKAEAHHDAGVSAWVPPFLTLRRFQLAVETFIWA